MRPIEPKGSNKASPVSERIRNVGVASGGGGVASGGGGGDGFGDEMMFRYLNEQQQLVYSALYNKSKIVDQRDRHTSGSLNDFGESQRSASESECNEGLLAISHRITRCIDCYHIVYYCIYRNNVSIFSLKVLKLTTSLVSEITKKIIIIFSITINYYLQLCYIKVVKLSDKYFSIRNTIL